MEVIAKLNNLRISPRKVRLVAKAIKGMDAMSAKHHLDYIIKKSSNPISKLLSSAMANGHNGLGLVKENLFIKDIVVNEGPKLKRIIPKGFGMASPIEKKTSHIKIILEEKVPGLKREETVVKKQELKVAEQEIQAESGGTKEGKMQIKLKPDIKKEIGKKGGIFGQSGKIKKFFRRKTI
ncbi:MAG: 50S ribosomal protein L22 [Candidatus Yanofskybacteria bacterium]|nr:50S ribosomal protein L22 [Candidatus Yanofskybacteria bacterium]